MAAQLTLFVSDPLIQVLDLDDLKQELNKECELCSHGIFVVSATDGMMDELEPQYVANTLAKSLWGSEDQCVQGQQEQTDCPEKKRPSCTHCGKPHRRSCRQM